MIGALPATARIRRLPRPAPKLVAGAVLLLLVLLCAVAPQHVAPYDPLGFDYMALLQGPSWAHPFGTDQFGRDVLSRTIWATRVDLQIALFGTLGPILIGTTVGLLIGYRRGWLDTLFGRLVDLVITFPFLVIVIAIVAMLGPGLGNLYLAVTVVGWVFYAQLMRAEVLVQMQSDYVAACKVMGFSPLRIALRHLLPNTITPIIVYWMTDMALVILLGSSLGYLGLGAQPPTAEWGVLVADGKNYMNQAWWVAFFPGAAVVLCGLAFSLFGDGVADTLRGRR